MPSFFILLILSVLTIAAAIVEFRGHQRRIGAIPHRIHVNGTRGKSSVTRLIGAGLRAGGVATITKVTGTFPRLILADGSDVPVHRKASPSILEQLNIVDFARKQGAEALVIECMALDPDYQRITEHQMVHATIPVMINIRLDHTDVMGRTLEEIGEAMANTIPRNSRVFTAEEENIDLLRGLAEARGSEVVQALGGVTQDDLDGFRYIEHRENVSLALAVCAELGVDREAALRGMWDAQPDAGVLTRSRVVESGSTVTFFNAFAANDPDSSLLIWQKLRQEGLLRGRRCILLNSRPDRKERSEQLAHLVGERLADDVDTVFVMGEPTEVVVRRIRAHGMDERKIVDLGQSSPEAIYLAILDRSAVPESAEHGSAEGVRESSVVAIGNMGGGGAATVDFFEERSRKKMGGENYG